MAMAVAAIGSIAFNTVHSSDYMVASVLKTRRFKHFSIPATTSFGRDSNSRLPSSNSLKKLRLFSTQTVADTATTSTHGKTPLHKFYSAGVWLSQNIKFHQSHVQYHRREYGNGRWTLEGNGRCTRNGNGGTATS